MSFGIGNKVEIINSMYLGRWIEPLEKGEIIGRHCSPSGQEVYDVKLEDGKKYTFAPSELEITECDNKSLTDEEREIVDMEYNKGKEQLKKESIK